MEPAWINDFLVD